MLTGQLALDARREHGARNGVFKPGIDRDDEARERPAARFRQPVARRVPRGDRRGESRRRASARRAAPLTMSVMPASAGDVVVVEDAVGRVHRRLACRRTDPTTRRRRGAMLLLSLGNEYGVGHARRGHTVVRPELILVAHAELQRQVVGQAPVVLREEREVAVAVRWPTTCRSPECRRRAGRARAPGCR